jgi:DNA gyrase/topoisomerase IV subunit B
LRVIAPAGHVDGVKMVVTEQTSRRRATQKGKKPGHLADQRALLQVKVEDQVEAGSIFTVLMGKVVEPRRQFTEENAMDAKNPDI